MIGPVNHIAIAVPDLEAAAARYRDVLGADVSTPQPLPEHGVTVAFVRTGETKVELLEPLGEGSPISAFIERRPNGGMHHICYEVSSIETAVAKLEAAGARTLGPVKTGAHGNPVVFLDPRGFDGTLIELEEVARAF